MSFMEAQLTEKQYWLVIDGSCGMEAIPEELFDVSLVSGILDSEDSEKDANARILAHVKGYLESRRIYSVELIEGYGVRSSTPGYMDCTSWTVYENLREAEEAYAAEQAECEGEDEW